MNTESGSWPPIFYGTAWKKGETANVTREAIATGYRAIDTANQPQHYDEDLVGEGIAAAMEELDIGREDLFLQSKFTPIDGHGGQIPYDPEAPLEDQMEQSLQQSLRNLNTNYLDSYLLHAPYDLKHMAAADWVAWSKLEEMYQRGDVRRIGISNADVTHLEELMAEASVKPMAVQNRCFATTGWDYNVRTFCARNGIAYQGFSLLTANPSVLKDAKVRQVADTRRITPQQVVFAFARDEGIIPLTGTTSKQHMADDLAAMELDIDDNAVAAIERIAA